MTKEDIKTILTEYYNDDVVFLDPDAFTSMNSSIKESSGINKEKDTLAIINLGDITLINDSTKAEYVNRGQGIFVSFRSDGDSSRLKNLKVIKTVFTPEEALAGFIHPHVPVCYNYVSALCTKGIETDIGKFIVNAIAEITEADLVYMMSNIKQWISVQSMIGGPYIRFETLSIRGGSYSTSMSSFSKYSSLNDYDNAITNITMKLLNRNLPISISGNSIHLAEDFISFAIRVTNIIIDLINNASSERERMDYEECLHTATIDAQQQTINYYNCDGGARTSPYKIKKDFPLYYIDENTPVYPTILKIEDASEYRMMHLASRPTLTKVITQLHYALNQFIRPVHKYEQI